MPEFLTGPKPAGTVIVGMSGGVDSAVAALRLRDAGCDVQGLFMANWDDDEAYCTAATDYQDARRVCELLGIALHRVNFAAEYRQRVFDHFLHEIAAGRTPNPDVLCNREIKFGVCLDYMHRLGAEWVATGHYARIVHEPPGPRLLKAVDASKDQSYFLHAVKPEALARTLFPLGDLPKSDVRRLAHAAGLPVHDKPDSTGICFIGERPFAEFLSAYVADAPGPIETVDGLVIGRHRGLAFYTLGQRGGLGLGGRADSKPAPWYVAAKDAARRALIVVQSPDHPLLLSGAFEVRDAHWLVAPPAAGEFGCAVKTRYRQRDLKCRVALQSDGRLWVRLEAPARAVTPGQYAVFYDGDICLGGGVIWRRDAPARAPEARGNAYNETFAAEGS